MVVVSQGHRTVVEIHSSDSEAAEEADWVEQLKRKGKPDVAFVRKMQKATADAEDKQKAAECKQKAAECKQLDAQLKVDEMMRVQPVDCSLECGRLMRHNNVNILSCGCKVCPDCVTSGVRNSMIGGGTPLCKAFTSAHTVCNKPIKVYQWHGCCTCN